MRMSKHEETRGEETMSDLDTALAFFDLTQDLREFSDALGEMLEVIKQSMGLAPDSSFPWVSTHKEEQPEERRHDGQ